MTLRRSGGAAATAALLLLLTSSIRAAETKPAGSSGAPTAAPAPQASAPAPYDPDLLRLSQIVGALAYLGDLCGKGDGDVWRAKMAKLLQAVGDSEIRRQRMAGAFNKGFRDYELSYRSCTANAQAVISLYVAEGATLTRDISSRYGGG
jgi:uncharacterized protein (TIGR02301 family)